MLPDLPATPANKSVAQVDVFNIIVELFLVVFVPGTGKGEGRGDTRFFITQISLCHPQEGKGRNYSLREAAGPVVKGPLRSTGISSHQSLSAGILYHTSLQEDHHQVFEGLLYAIHHHLETPVVVITIIIRTIFLACRHPVPHQSS